MVREIGRGRDVEERSLEMTEVSWEGGRRWCRQESGLQILWKKERESLSRLSLSEFKLATNRRWDMTFYQGKKLPASQLLSTG